MQFVSEIQIDLIKLWQKHRHYSGDVSIGVLYMTFFFILLSPLIDVLSVIKWLFLGVISSIGVGWGIPTGPLFLYPWIFNNRDLEYFSCIFPWSMCWGIGTALGEIPLFLMASKLDPETTLQGLKWSTRYQNGLLRAIQHIFNIIIIDLTVNIVRYFGWVGVVLLSSWHNFSFDVCGLACGALRMRPVTFISGLFLGKVLIKSTLESLFIYHSVDLMTLLFGPITSPIDQENSAFGLFIDWFPTVWTVFTFVWFSAFLKSALHELAKD